MLWALPTHWGRSALHPRLCRPGGVGVVIPTCVDKGKGAQIGDGTGTRTPAATRRPQGLPSFWLVHQSKENISEKTPSFLDVCGLLSEQTNLHSQCSQCSLIQNPRASTLRWGHQRRRVQRRSNSFPECRAVTKIGPHQVQRAGPGCRKRSLAGTLRADGDALCPVPRVHGPHTPVRPSLPSGIPDLRSTGWDWR